MMLLYLIVMWTFQVVLFLIGVLLAGLSAHLGGGLIALAFEIDELIPSAIIFFAVAALLGWIGNRLWPEGWLGNPLL